MKPRNFIKTTLYEYLTEGVTFSKYKKLVSLARGNSYEDFLSKSDSLTGVYNILYRGMNEGDSITDKSFMTDYIGHAREYGEYVDGIICNNGDVLHFDDNTFDKLRKHFKDITIYDLNEIYSYYFKHDKLFDAMDSEYDNIDSVILLAWGFIRSSKPYSVVQKNKIKNDLLIPIMQHYATLNNKNIISFVGGDYSDYGGAEEFVVDDSSRYVTLSSIWKSVN